MLLLTVNNRGKIIFLWAVWLTVIVVADGNREHKHLITQEDVCRTASTHCYYSILLLFLLFLAQS